MTETSEKCCLCLEIPKNSFIDLFSKLENGLTVHKKISSTLHRLANVLNEKSSYNLKLCHKCCDTIDMVYEFNESCLRNFGIFLSQKTVVKVEPPQFSQIPNSNAEKQCTNENFFTGPVTFVKIEPVPSDIDLNKQFEPSCPQDVHEKVFIKEEYDENPKDISCVPDVYWYDENIEEKIEIDEPDLSDSFRASSKDITTEKFCENFSSKEDLLIVCQKKAETKRKKKSKTKKLKSGFDCLECGKKFTLKGNLKLHMASHSNEKKFQCMLCEKSFKHNFDLNKHMVIHTGDRPYPCELCNLSFRQKSALTSHIKVKHEENRPFACDQCEKQFTSKGNLDVHKRSHSGEKPFICEVCLKGFTTNSALNRHKRIHTGEKPYLCSICTKAFNDISTLHKHKLVHKGAIDTENN